MNNSIIITESDIRNNITLSELIDTVDETYQWYSNGKVEMPAKITLNMEKFNKPGWINSMPSYIEPLNILGIKWAGGFLDNNNTDLPYIMSQILINNPDNGKLKALLDGNWITNYRTGAQSAVAAKYLANNKNTLAIIGAGDQGFCTAACMLELFELDEIKVFDINKDNSLSFKEKLKDITSTNIILTDTIEETISNMDIIVTATTANKPLVKEEWVKEGALISSIGSYQEIEDKMIFSADKLYVDHIEQNLHRGEFYRHFNSNSLRENDIVGEIGDLITGKIKGREGKKERIIISPIGMGCLDISISAKVYNRMIEKNQSLNKFDLMS